MTGLSSTASSIALLVLRAYMYRYLADSDTRFCEPAIVNAANDVIAGTFGWSAVVRSQK